MTTALKLSPLGGYTAKETDLAWAAGLFDGDGCILISKQHQPGRKNPTYRLTLSLVQNDYQTITYFKRLLALKSCLVTVPRTTGQNRNVYDLRYDGVHALRALQLLKPYLRRKQIEAVVAVEAWIHCAWGVLPGWRGLPPEVWKKRERYYKKLKALK